MISCYYLITSRVRLAVVCGPDRVVGDSSYCKVMQCVTSCRRSIVQCEHSSDWLLPQIVVQCENNGEPMTLKIAQCELGISEGSICGITLIEELSLMHASLLQFSDSARSVLSAQIHTQQSKCLSCRVSHINTVGYGLSERKHVGENWMCVNIACMPSVLKGQHS